MEAPTLSSGSASRPEYQKADTPRRSLAALSRTRHRLRRLNLLDGAICCGLVVTAALPLSFALDYVLDLPVGIRGLFLFGGALGLAILVHRRVFHPLSVQVADEDLALLVEECNPELRQSLLTAIQLSSRESEGARYVSTDLLAAVIRDVEERVQGTSFERVFRLGRMYRNAGALAAMAVVVAWGALSAPDLASIWLRRNLFLGGERWPKGTRLELFPALPDTVAVGDNLLVEVRLLKGHPKVVSVRRDLAGGGSRQSVMDLKEKASWDVVLAQGGESGRDEEGRGAARYAKALEAVGVLDAESRKSVDRGAGILARGLRRRDAEELARRFDAAGGKVRLEGYDVYVHEFRNISRPLRFSVEGGDDEIGPFGVDVRLRPRIDMKSVAVKYRLPPYTGKGEEEHVQRHGNLKVPAGTRVTFSMSTNIPVRRAYFLLRQGDEPREPESPGSAASESDVPEVARRADTESWPAPGAVTLELEEGRRFSGNFVVTGSGHYFFQFEDEYGFRSRKPERFRIQAIPDRKPQVRIVEPERITEEVSPDAKVRVRVSIKDDYGIRRAVLEGAYFPPGKDTRVDQSIPLPGVGAEDPAQAQAEYPAAEYILEVAKLNTGGGERPSPGARFEFFALAEDFGATGRHAESGEGVERGRPIGNIGESQVHMLEIVDKDVLDRLLTDRLMLVRDRLRQLMGRQEAVRKNLEGLREKALLREGEIPEEEARKLSRHRRDQGKIGEALGRQVAEVDRILAKTDANAVGDERWKRWVSKIRSEIDDLARRRSPRVEQEIGQLRREALESARNTARLGPIIAAQREIERDLRSLVWRLEGFGDRSAILQLLRDVRKRQSELRDATRDQLESGGAEKEIK